MDPIHVSARDLRQRLAEVLSSVEYGGKTYVVTKNGRPVVRITPLQDAPIATGKGKRRT
jgi:prevent-host-death family protein